MRNSQRKSVSMGDSPSALQKFYWGLAGRCKKCGGELEAVYVRGRHKKTHVVHICVSCDHRC